MDQPRANSLNDSLLVQNEQRKGIEGFLTRIDLFCFIPVPKDNPVSTRRSMVGSLIFIFIALGYILQDFYFFVTDNPPVVQQYTTNLGFEFYELPDVAITFMQGQSLNETQQYKQYLKLQMTKQLKDKSSKLATQIPLALNNYERLSRWLNKQTTDFYYKLYSPTETMKARGLLYSTENCNYTKITIKRCDFTNPSAGCASQKNITSKMAKGRIFLFIETQKDESSASLSQPNPSISQFTIANFFLIPKIYKRVTVTFEVVKTQVFPDYFTSWTKQITSKVDLKYITQMTSDVTINADEYNVAPLQMMGIQFQLSPSILNVRVSYSNLLDRVGKWGGFCNALFTVFAIFFLRYNRQKFYKKNPNWNNFKEHSQGFKRHSAI